MVNTILAKRVNYIVAKGDHPVWPKGSKSRGFSNNLIDEMVVYILPVIAGKGTLVFDDLTPSRWNMYKTTSFSNGITRIIYRNSCILQ